MKILYFGSRDWTDYNKILNDLLWCKEIYGDIEIIEGGCRGADLLARKAAESLGIKCTEFKVTKSDWDTHGKAAGPLRNAQMLYEGKPDLGRCFHEDIDNSKGSRDMIDKLRRAKIFYNIIDAN